MKAASKVLSFLFSIYLLASASGCAHVQETVAQEEPASGYDTSYSQAHLDQILAPIALYPDSLLSHILIAATYPLEVIQAHRWSSENGNLAGDEALAAAEVNEWDSSVLALTAFPEVLERMSNELEWMQSLGDAFLQDEAIVLATIQDLRSRAQAEGSLADLDHIEVIEDDSDNIVIESRVREIVYVPHYDTRVVYGPWWWASYPPVYWSTGLSFYWGPQIYVGRSIYFSSFHWRNRHLVVLDRHHYRDRVYSSRHVTRHASSRRWVHNVSHRRGVHYRSPVVRQRYARQYRNDVATRQQRHLHNDRARSDAVVRRLNERSERAVNRNERSVNGDNRAVIRDDRSRNRNDGSPSRNERSESNFRNQREISRSTTSSRETRNPAQRTNRDVQQRTERSRNESNYRNSSTRTGVDRQQRQIKSQRESSVSRNSGATRPSRQSSNRSSQSSRDSGSRYSRSSSASRDIR